MDLVPYIFHEQQEGNLCAQHCLNALLQGPYFTAIDLAELAQQLDQQEAEALGNHRGNSTLFSEKKHESQNMDDSGFFSVQVLSQALTIWNCQIIPWGAKEVRVAKSEPEREVAFICNLDQHWYTLRRFGPSIHRWYDLNSMLPEPRHMSATFLGMTLSQLEAEGYSIFVVRPLSTAGDQVSPNHEQPNVTQSGTESGQSRHDPASKKELASLPATMQVDSTPSQTASPAGFLSERQEMERIRRARLEERERATALSTSSTSSKQTSSVGTEESSINQNKRTRIDRDGEEHASSKAQSSPLVKTPVFLPRCDADAKATTLPTENVQSSQSTTAQAQDTAFSGSGYRLGGSSNSMSNNTGGATAASSSSGFGAFNDREAAGFQDSENDDDADTEWEMMQQAIAMSLSTNK
ncbi:Ataxin-3 [Podila epigama]|nr:Ataxin-3 [Podila epigama]